MKLFNAMFETRPLDGLEPVRTALLSAEVTAPPQPWTQTATVAVGGLMAVGFDRASEMILVVSSQGQSVIDCRTGDTLYCNEESDGYDIGPLKAARLDHPAAERFDMAGMHGGALKSVTEDGWAADQFVLDWPETRCVLQPPGASVFALNSAQAARDANTAFHLLAKERESVHAFGFSWRGQSLALATSSRLRIWSRSPLPL